MKKIEIILSISVAIIIFGSWEIESWINNQFKHGLESKIQWSSHPVMSTGFGGQNTQLQIIPVEIGFREDGVVCWREPRNQH